MGAAYYKVGALIAEPGQALLQNRRLRQIAFNDINPVDGLDGEPVDGQQSALRPNTLGHVLRPAAGCRPQIDNGLAGLEQFFALVEFLQLVSGTRPILRGARLANIRVAAMLLKPAARTGPTHSLTRIRIS